jgi:hypothetical protein
VFGFLNVISFTFDILLTFVSLRELSEKEALQQEVRASRSTQSMPPKFVTGKGSYRHRLSQTSSKLGGTKFQDQTPVILKEGTPIAQI